ncbi:hypothetical protein [Alkalicoccus luteus]|uniref:Uncharacterized protein n=1 Tax=Alkalicoccus luteus TaxID=1237094 RepID=A0A969TU56_9BACI|nr:hypothetical protein [Alkalicoccus luteus]NJP38363.1 hypothetical protein [Alkalicoccus luteus]
MEPYRLAIGIHIAMFFFFAVVTFGYLSVTSDPAMVRDTVFYLVMAALSALAALLFTVTVSASFYTVRYVARRISRQSTSS